MRIELGKEEGVGIKISTAENYPRGREYSDENLFGTFVFPMTVRPRRKTSFIICYFFFFFRLDGAFLTTDIEVCGP